MDHHAANSATASVALLALAASGALSQETPQAALAVAFPAAIRTPLYRAPADLALDGDVAEWQALPPTAHGCNTPFERSQAGETWVAWNDAGLCVAARVWDNDLFGFASGVAPAENRRVRWPCGDAVLLNVDLRDYAKETEGANPPYEFALRPPYSPDGKATSWRWTARAKPLSLDGVQVAGRAVEGGWTVEALVPWPALGGYDPAKRKDSSRACSSTTPTRLTPTARTWARRTLGN